MTKPPAPHATTRGHGGEVAALLKAARAVLENRAFADAAQALLAGCKTIVGAQGGLVAVRATAGKGYDVAIRDPAGLELGPAAGLPAPLRSLGARAAKAGRAVFANDLAPGKGAKTKAAKSEVAKSEVAKSEVTKSVAGRRGVVASALLAPIVVAGDLVGLLCLLDKPGGFAAADGELAEVFGAMAAVAMLHSRAADEAERRARGSTVRMQSLARRLVEAQESERRNIARELHDEAGQALASLRFGLRMLESEVAQGASVTSRVAELTERTDAVIDGLHRLAADLRPASLDYLGLEAALRQYARSAASKFGLAVHFKARGFTADRLPSVVETALYRVVQEAMANVVRHAHATRVDLLVERRGDRVIVMIEDDGVGFDPEQVQRGDHFGLLGLRERAESLGGSLTLESAPGAGTTVVVEVASADPHPDR